MLPFNDEFRALRDAHFPILLCETHEESWALTRLREICNARNTPLFLRSLADGLERSTEANAVYTTPVNLPMSLSMSTSRRKNGLPRLVERSEGYSGTEIEQAITAAQYAALAAGGPLMHAHVESELMQTRLLSVIRAEAF